MTSFGRCDVFAGFYLREGILGESGNEEMAGGSSGLEEDETFMGEDGRK
ncbi:uncharacterized protein FIBRA_08816 [Fibroporia radiculosa]|uniref:Uncharacterized protein n=1 Tax=Fibroporia radiculosa TaxID=599839 RepID=J4I3D2_9APHY|nr:uncharacterized protein FIBRA_08816 [Fibroporia radiculosa]CCM06542.1 predicted protein [Fibroporia radiculosa]